MGLSVAIGGSIAVITLAMSLSVFPMMVEDVHDLGVVESEISKITRVLDRTNFQISSINAEVESNNFDFLLTNTGSEKLWNYEDFDLFVTYDADIGGVSTRHTESFIFNETASFAPPPTPLAISRPDSDVLKGGWRVSPLFGKIDESIRDDGDLITSPLEPRTPANDVEIALSAISDPNTSSGHVLRYTFRTSDVVDAKGLLGYGEVSIATPRYQSWSTGIGFGGEQSANLAASSIEWVVIKSAPYSVEKIMGILSSDGNLYIQTWDGVTWSSNWSTNIGDDSTRRFDIAYEQNSGDPIVVFGDGTSELKYRKRVAAGGWDAADQTAGSPMADYPYWVILESKPNTDDIFVATITRADTISAMKWDGSLNTWGEQITTSSVVENKAYKGVDIAFESNTGNAFLIWGDDNRNLKYKEYTGIWQSELNAYALPEDIFWLEADYNPSLGRNDIAVGMTLRNGDFEFGAWDGFHWVTRPSPIESFDRTKDLLDVDFETSTNKAMYTFVQKTNDRQFSWRTWDYSAGFGSITTNTPDTGDKLQGIQLIADPLSNDMMVLYANNQADLFYNYWNGSSWSSSEPALELNLSEKFKESFMFAWDHVPTVELTVNLEEGKGPTIISQWVEGNILSITEFVQRDRTLTAVQANTITDYSDLRVKYKVTGGEVQWSWAEFVILPVTPEVDTGEWGISGINDEVLDPKILNPNESAELGGKLTYNMVSGGLIQITIISDMGQAATSSFIVS